MNNRVEIDGKRYYDTPIGTVPSVTTVLSILDKGPWFHKWLANNNAQAIEKKTSEACDLGTRVHEKIEHWIKTRLAGIKFERFIKPDEMPCMEGFWKWEQEHDIQYIKTEMFLYSKDGFAGTMDIAAIVDGELSQIDIKTSKAFYDTMGLQLSAYGKAYEEMSGEKFKKLIILRLDKIKGTPHPKEFKNEYKIFKKVLDVFNWRNNGKGRDK